MTEPMTDEQRTELTKAQLKVENKRLREEKKYLLESMRRMANGMGIEDPIQLIAMAKDDEETYTDILVKHATKLYGELAKLRKVVRAARTYEENGDLVVLSDALRELDEAEK